MNKTSKIIIIGGSTVVVGIIVASIIANKRRVKNVVAELETYLKQAKIGNGKFGDVSKLDAFDPAYYKTQPVETWLAPSTAKDDAKVIHDLLYGSMLGFEDIDRDAVVTFVQKFNHKVFISQIADYYKQAYGKLLSDDIQKVGDVVNIPLVNWEIGKQKADDAMKKIYNYISTLAV